MPGARAGLSAYAAIDGSFQALVCLQLEQTRSPGQELLNSVPHIRHFRIFASYLRSDSGFLFLLESLIDPSILNIFTTLGALYSVTVFEKPLSHSQI